ncbi:(Fe-S)-binding protein [Alteribacillus sp. HJP-4]|uniref:(Fe-S)-binding protein n=1 Tax=Alteribacillus sp. HJP-4 TaxID=2775394 RepID=UPI0035CD275F
METQQKHPQAEKLHNMAHDAANQCIQCGYCLPSCPTYLSMGKESASPRGRINLVKMAAEGRIDLSQDLAEPIDLCLGCRACETACPVDVPYGHILESAKDSIKRHQAAEKQAPKGSAWKEFLLNQVFTRPAIMKTAGSMTWFYQKSGAGRVVRKTNLLTKLSEPVGEMEKILPPVEHPAKRLKRGTVLAPYTEKKTTVSFFSGCVSEAVLNRTNRLSVELLRHVGCEVVISSSQNCCGALHSHQGSSSTAKSLARENIKAFEETGASYIVNNAGGCGASLKEYPHLLRDEQEWKKRAEHFSNASKDISELLVSFDPLPFKKDWKGTITYQPSCHLSNVQKVTDAPRQLLRSIPGADYVEMENSEGCCASGGIYNILQYHESMKILDEKMKYAAASNAAVIISTNPGCLLQMRLGIKRAGLEGKAEGMHLVDILAEACDIK